jgi:hypothetical protein
MSRHGEMSRPEIANFLAAKCVAAATSYLAGRSGAARLAREADSLCGELLDLGFDHDCNAIADPARLLVVAMMSTAIAERASFGPDIEAGPRLLRWRAIMAALVDLVLLESKSMRRPARRTENVDILRGARAE